MVFIFLFVIILMGIVGYSLFYGISPMPSSRKACLAMVEMVPKNFSGDIYELGSGFGSLAFTFAKRFPKARITSFEASFFPWLFSFLRQKMFRVKNLNFYEKDFFKISLFPADLIICYLYPKAMMKLKDKFEKELEAGTLIITNTFAIPGWKPSKISILNDIYRTKIYLYILAPLESCK